MKLSVGDIVQWKDWKGIIRSISGNYIITKWNGDLGVCKDTLSWAEQAFRILKKGKSKKIKPFGIVEFIEGLNHAPY